jgi:anti-sigma regulatory factor (Ser/Thr protein kinase)
VLTRWLQQHDLDREVATEITIAVGEACANAIEHAYGPGRGRFKVRVEEIDGALEVTVTDEGRWRPSRGENRGRGLKIMKAAMDSLDVSSDDAGTVIMMRRNLRRR